MSLVTNAHVPTFGNFEPPLLTSRSERVTTALVRALNQPLSMKNKIGKVVLFFQTSFSTGGEGESCLEGKTVYYLFFNKEGYNFYFAVNFVNQEKTTRHS